jgi:predicted RNase H-like HicB family nuclease
MEYIAYLHKDRESDYGVSFPDLPGCVTAGRTLEEARRMARETLALHLAGMAEDGEAVPEPSRLDDLASDPARKDAVCFLVSADVPNRVLRVNITAKESQLRTIDEFAAAAGMSRSAFIVHSALHEGLRLRDASLLTPGNARRSPARPRPQRSRAAAQS